MLNHHVGTLLSSELKNCFQASLIEKISGEKHIFPRQVCILFDIFEDIHNVSISDMIVPQVQDKLLFEVQLFIFLVTNEFIRLIRDIQISQRYFIPILNQNSKQFFRHFETLIQCPLN